MMQLPLAQQPAGQEVPSHTHWPLAQRSPGLQASVPPQLQLPLGLHWSAVVAAQAAQSCPPTPQVPKAEVSHVPLCVQQPLGQLWRSQVQRPKSQRCPTAQAAPVPQAQVPPAPQPSAVTAEQAVQAAPASPQLARLGARQVLPEQHPTQSAAQPLQAPPAQVCPDGQV